MGLGSNGDLAARYSLGINDAAVIDGVIAYLRNRHDPRLDAGWVRTNIANSLGGHSEFNWFVYEQSARELYWHLWRTETPSMLHLYLIDKPREIAHVIVAAARRDPAPWRSRHGLYFAPFAVGPLIVILPGLVIACTRRPRFAPVLAGALALLACSTIPGILFYAVVHTMMGVFATLCLAVYLTVALVFAAACRLADGGASP
jgi:hypothetical protein